MLLCPITKTHSKAKGVPMFVSLPKIDELHVRYRGLNVYLTFDLKNGDYSMPLSEE